MIMNDKLKALFSPPESYSLVYVESLEKHDWSEGATVALKAIHSSYLIARPQHERERLDDELVATAGETVSQFLERPILDAYEAKRIKLMRQGLKVMEKRYDELMEGKILGID